MTMQSCVDCPSLMTGTDAAVFFGANDSKELDGLVVCSRFSYVVGDGTNQVRTELAERYAAKCVSYGKDAPPVAPPEQSRTFGVYTPNNSLLVPPPSGVTKASSCDSCVKFDSSIGACAATGQIVLDTDRKDRAARCPFGLNGTPNGLVGELLPGWDGAVTTWTAVGAPTRKTAGTKKQAAPAPVSLPIEEPVDHLSDAKVTDEHIKAGIKAWRAVETPRGRIGYLPIFRTDYFTEEQQAHIPKSGSDYGDPALYIDHDGLEVEFMVQVYERDFNLCLVGPPGSGKTEGVRWLAWRINMPFNRLTYNESSEVDQVLGMPGFDPAVGTKFDLGFLPLGWISPNVLLSDEPNLPPEAIVQVYRSMNDSSRELVVYNQRFRRHDYCFHVMALNPHTDFRNIGAKPLASADSRRLTFHLMSPPDDDMLRTIITKSLAHLDKGATIDAGPLKAIIEIGKDLRHMSAENELPDFWTPSQDVKVARLVADFGLVGAYRRAYLNYIDQSLVEDVIVPLIKTKIPNGVDWS